MIVRFWSNAAKIPGVRRSELQNPPTDRFIADFQSTFGRPILDVTIAQGEPKIELYGTQDDVRWEAVVGVGDGFHRPP
jgi:hypothetical protein